MRKPAFFEEVLAMTRVTGCMRCGRPYRPRLYLQPLCDDCLDDRKRARAHRVPEECFLEMQCSRCDRELDNPAEWCSCRCHKWV